MFRSRRLLAALAPLACTAAFAQQFTEESATRFPQPAPSEYTNQLTVGDLDGDGDLDLVWANGGNFTTAGSPQLLRVYINDGSGVFSDETAARTGNLTGLHRGVELGDCDRDGDLDILGAQDFNRPLTLLVNDGTGVFSSEAATRLPTATLSSSRAQFGDVDNDGDLDIFVTTGTTSRFTCGQYRLYLNDGACVFSDATTTHVPVGVVCNNMDCIFGDIDGDFDLDIRTASTGNNNSRLYVNDGDGVFSLSAAPNDSSCYSYDFGDIDGDGDLDLLGANGLSSNNGEILLENNGFGSYSDVSGQISPNPNQDDNDSKFLDYDDDGDLDLIIARLGSGGEKLYRNDGSGSFTQILGEIQVLNDASLDVMVADVNGDGAYDIITAQGESGSFLNRIYMNNGPVDSRAPRVVKTERLVDPPGPGPFPVRAAILDDHTSDRNFFDSGIDLIYSVDGGASQSVPMLHSGGQIYRGEIPPQAGGASVTYSVLATDWNGNLGSGLDWTFVIPDCSALADCSGNGTCLAGGTCDCDPAWMGADCSQVVPSPAGEVPDGSTIAGQQLLARKLPGGDARFFWAGSCFAGDDDYAFYEGDIGDFTTHLPVTCSTGGARNLTFTPGPDAHYYLVTPTNPDREGSYGRDSSGAERPESAEACAPPGVQSCL